MIDQAIAWCTSHWWLISAALLFVASVLNSVTRHYAERAPAIVPLFGVLLEALSFITSRGKINGVFGKLKLPMQDVSTDSAKPKKPSGVISGVIGVLILFVVVIPGCNSLDGKLQDAHQIVAGFGSAAIAAIHIGCSEAASKCGDKVPPADCQAWVACDAKRAQIAAGIGAVEEGLLAIEHAFKAAKEAGVIR